MIRVGSLFAGIGGIDLGLERAGGFETVWFSEIDAYCVRVLQARWPGVPVFGDVRALDGATLPAVDMLVGGFPCQDLSLAGKAAGIEGSRSGLWAEFARLIGEVRPRYVLVENVSALRRRGLDRVLGDLASIGYDAEWHCITAASVGAPHRRDRIYLLAYPQRAGLEGHGSLSGQPEVTQPRDCCPPTGDLPYPHDGGRDQGSRLQQGESPEEWGRRFGYPGGAGWQGWSVEPDVGRVVDGVPYRVDRLRALGNAVVPQVTQWIGTQIMQHERDVTSQWWS